MTPLDNQKIYQSLSELKVITQDKLDALFKEAGQNNGDLSDLLISRDLISDENLGKVIADLLSVPFVKLSRENILPEILHIIPEVVAKKQRLIAFKKDNQGLSLAMNDPHNQELITFITKKAGLPVKVYYSTKRDLENAFYLYSQEISKAFADIMEENIKEAGGKSGKALEPPIIKIVDTIINYAYQNKASDIHLETQDKQSLVRFRIDGVLHDIEKLPGQLHAQVVTRLKVLSGLRTDEHQSAQDGKIKYQTKDEEVDIRISIVPTIEGEKIVMRLLSEKSRQFSLGDLGVDASNLHKITKAYQKPYGMILATGPTGSGKTTTMYAILKILNRREINIMTIEDPVEYDIEGINQIQVNPKTNLNFAAGLRSIVRQDPNIILVGEIRDEETAGIAINSAMTGHLVLSTLHTNDAATAIPRLFDLKVEPFLVASSVNVIIAQRLVRKICEKCRYSLEITRTNLLTCFTEDVVKKSFGTDSKIRTYQGKGCPVCHQTGYVERIGIFEVLELDDEIKAAIVKHDDAGVIKKIAVKKGMSTILEDGLSKVKSGSTTVDEIIRVTKE